jgi:hypothetical protein
MQLQLQTVGRGRVALDVSHDVTVAALRAAAAEACGFPIPRTKLVASGRVLLDSDGSARLADGDKVFCLSAPEAPAAGAAGEDAEPEDVVAALRLSRLRLSAPVRRAAARLVAAGVPEPLLALLLSVRLGSWLTLAGWCLACRAASRLDVGAPFVLASAFAAIFANLGSRAPGAPSAYSLFNDGFARLPGDAAPEEIDRQLRAGQMM